MSIIILRCNVVIFIHQKKYAKALANYKEIRMGVNKIIFKLVFYEPVFRK